MCSSLDDRTLLDPDKGLISLDGDTIKHGGRPVGFDIAIGYKSDTVGAEAVAAAIKSLRSKDVGGFGGRFRSGERG